MNPSALPNETWLCVLRFCSRSALGQRVSLCCRRFHALAHPFMHELGTRRLWGLWLEGDKERPHDFWISRLLSDPSRNILLDEPPSKNIACIDTLTIHGNVTPGVCAFIAFLARHGLLRELNVHAGSSDEMLRDLLDQFPALFVPHPLFSILEIPLAQRNHRLLCHPLVLGLPVLWICIGRVPERAGPLINWLHSPTRVNRSSCVGTADDGGHPQHRLLRVTFCGHGSDEFLNRFLNALVQRFLSAKRARPFWVEFWYAEHNEWPVLEAEPEWHNPRAGEVMRVRQVVPVPEGGGGMRVFRVERCRQPRPIGS